MLEGKKIAIGVTGGIACYKVVTLVSRLVQAGAEVRVVMSEAATKLVSPLLFKEISGAPVAYDMWRGNDEFNVEHVALGRWCDLMVVAPATANIIGKMAGGIADDLLSTTLMACDKPKIICPAMNTNMFVNPIVPRCRAQPGNAAQGWHSYHAEWSGLPGLRHQRGWTPS